jgi:hypothetical protein
MTKEFDNPGSAPKDGAASEANVTCTAVHQLAQACARAICNGERIDTWLNSSSNPAMKLTISQRQVAERLERTLNANSGLMREAGKPTS